MRPIVIFLLLLAGSAQAQLPAYGVPVPELAALDDIMQGYMFNNGIDSGVLAVSVGGRTIYQRGFGVDVEENTPMRLASLEKPITAAAAGLLVADGALNWNDFAFDLGQAGGGILPHVPYAGLGDTRLRQVTVQHLLNHVGGWDRDTAQLFGQNDSGDPQFETLQIAQTLGLPPPAGPDDIIRFMLSQPLQFAPGSNGCVDGNGNATFCYSNFGYMVLGRIVEAVSGQSIHAFVRSRVLTPALWVPARELVLGRSLYGNRHPQEPWYQGASGCTNVFQPAAVVECPYGGWHQEAFVGHGNLVAPVGPLLALMNRFRVAVQFPAGQPLPANSWNGNFSGALDGTSTRMRQRTGSYNIAVLFTRWDEIDHAATVGNLVATQMDATPGPLPTMRVDGYWLDSRVAGDVPHLGAFDRPFRTMSQALAVGAGTRLRLMPTVTPWSGVISHRVVIDAPLGSARIGG